MPETTNPQPQTTVSKKVNWKKVALTVVIIVVVAGIIVALYWFFILNRPKPTSTEPIKVSTPSAKVSTPSAKPATPSAEKDKTASWKSFSDKEKTISLKYPNTWYIREDPPIGKNRGIVIAPKKDFVQGPYIQIHIAKETSAFNTYKDLSERAVGSIVKTGENNPEYPLVSHERLENTTVDGEITLRQRSEPAEEGSGAPYQLILLVNKDIYILSVQLVATTRKDFSDNETLFSTVVSTIKFLD